MCKKVVVFLMLVGLCFSMSANAADKTNETANATWTFMAVSIKPTAEELAAKA